MRCPTGKNTHEGIGVSFNALQPTAGTSCSACRSRYSRFRSSVAANAGDRITGKTFATRSEVIAQHGMVATSHPLATQIGLDVLKKGGNAVDAAIAANAALGLMEPMSCGIGGDLFAIVWDAKTKKLYGLNASGRSPQALTLEVLPGARAARTIPTAGPLSWSRAGLRRRLGRAARALRQAAR